MAKVTKYVLGFLTDKVEPAAVVMIRKNRPKWQIGLLNGVGGKVEPHEHPHSAMYREFLEETGISITTWDHFATMHGNGFEVVCYHAEGNTHLCRTMTDEEVSVQINPDPKACIENIPWLLAMIKSRAKDHVDHYDIEYIRYDH